MDRPDDQGREREREMLKMAPRRRRRGRLLTEVRSRGGWMGWEMNPLRVV